MFLLYENLWFSMDGPSFLEDRASALPAVPSPSEEVIGTSTDLIAPSCEARALNTLPPSVPRDLVVSSAIAFSPQDLAQTSL